MLQTVRVVFFFIVDEWSFVTSRFSNMVFMLYSRTDKNILVQDVTVCNEHSICRI